MSDAVRLGVVTLILLAFLVTRPLEIRLWEAGRLSDRLGALLLLGRLPVFVALIAVVTGAPPEGFLLAVAAAAGGPLLLYRHVLRFLDDEAARRGLRERRAP